MAEVLCGFNDTPQQSGSAMLALFGPTFLVSVGFDAAYDPALKTPPTPAAIGLNALVDTGASISCIDSALAMQLGLPIVDRQTISGVHGAHEVNVHMAQIHVISLNFTIYGTFCAVDLIAGGQPHYVLLGRNFLRPFTMVYEGPTGTVKIQTA